MKETIILRNVLVLHPKEPRHNILAKSCKELLFREWRMTDNARIIWHLEILGIFRAIGES